MNPIDLSAAHSWANLHDPNVWLLLFQHFVVLSLMAIGGVITTAPDMHRFLVQQQNWISEAQFNASITLSQASPGPNVLFVAVLGWHVGFNASQGSAAWSLATMWTALIAILLPSSILTCAVTRWAQKHSHWPSIQSFKHGAAPVVIGLLLSSGWTLSAPSVDLSLSNLIQNPIWFSDPADTLTQQPWAAWGITAVTMILVLRTKIHLLVLLGAGAILGLLGWG